MLALNSFCRTFLAPCQFVQFRNASLLSRTLQPQNCITVPSLRASRNEADFLVDVFMVGLRSARRLHLFHHWKTDVPSNTHLRGQVTSAKRKATDERGNKLTSIQCFVAKEYFKPWPHVVARRRKFKTWFYLRFRLARPGMHLR